MVCGFEVQQAASGGLVHAGSIPATNLPEFRENLLGEATFARCTCQSRQEIEPSDRMRPPKDRIDEVFAVWSRIQGANPFLSP